MNLKDFSESRYSARAFLSQVVEREKIDYILDCVRLAPSACNYQPWKLYIVTDQSVQIKLQEAYDREWFKSAPVYIVVCKDSSLSWKRTASDKKDFGDVDAAIAGTYVCLAAVEVGLGTCWVCNFKPNMVKQALNLDSHLEAIAIFPIGYIDEEKSKVPEKKRYTLSEITRWI